jgi:hypothetical protein
LSPILVRPVREQLEHDRLIRLLHAKFRRRYETVMNPGNEQNAGIGTGPSTLYPDLLLMSPDRGRKLQVVVEIETGESVNHLEALAQWAHFARTRAAFHLYVPAGMVDVARRLAEDNQIHVGEIWSYHVVGDQPRFTLVHRSREAPPSLPKPKAAPKVEPAPANSVSTAAAKPARSTPKKPAIKPAASSKPKPQPKLKPKSKPKPKPNKAGKKKR